MAAKKKDSEEVIANPTSNWKFAVKANEIGPREKVCITGNLPALGEWDPARVVPMELQPNSDLWQVTVTVPNDFVIYYRYAICYINEDKEVVVQKWETSLQPRVINLTDLHPSTDVFGTIDNVEKITRGWLTVQTMIQFKFVMNPLKLKSRISGRPLKLKVTPVKLTLSTESMLEDASLSTDTGDTEALIGVSVEVCTLDNDPMMCTLQPQEQFGREYKPNDIMLVNISVRQPGLYAYLIDLYTPSSRATDGDPPCHVGYTYILPNMFKPSEGELELAMNCHVKHRPLGTINIQYLIVKPMEPNLSDFEKTFAKHWDSAWTGLEVGHRGLGASFKNKDGDAIRENTIASLKKAAASGADLLEFDVQLSKDMIPVIYHDFHVCISMKRKKEVDFSEMLELPVKDLTLHQLQKLKVYHLVEGRNHETLFFDEDLEEHQPFPTLEDVLKTIDPHVGLNVELKWTMELQDGTFELNNPFDMNTYVDKVLEVVLKHAHDRRIVFSCFNPDICTMVRYKQNKYPVMFLTIGVTKKYPPYRDPRCNSIPTAVQNAISTDILGIVVHTEDLLRDPTQVSLAINAGLVIFCWGDDNNDKNTIKKLKEMGIHAVIYDKLDQYSTKEVKESIFLVEARESQRDLIRLAGLNEPPEIKPVAAVASDSKGTSSEGGGDSESEATAGSSRRVPVPPPSLCPEAHLRLDTLRRLDLDTRSLATSLESLASTPSEHTLKRQFITNIDKELQLKEPWPMCAATEPTKKPRQI